MNHLNSTSMCNFNPHNTNGTLKRVKKIPSEFHDHECQGRRQDFHTSRAQFYHKGKVHSNKNFQRRKTFDNIFISKYIIILVFFPNKGHKMPQPHLVCGISHNLTPLYSNWAKPHFLLYTSLRMNSLY